MRHDHDWLLVETLGAEPAVVAQGQHTKNLVPISAFLRRNPNLMAIQTAINETVRAGKALSSLTPKNDRVIRTEVVQMTDGRIHGVHVWIGPLDDDPPDRRAAGSAEVGSDQRHRHRHPGVADQQRPATPPSRPPTAARSPRTSRPGTSTRSEARVLAVAIKPEAGRTFCSTWDVTDYKGKPITVGFVGAGPARSRRRRARRG